MRLLGQKILLTESTKRNLCLLPGVLGLVGVMLVESCESRRTNAPASERELKAMATVASLPSPGTNGASTPQALGPRVPHLRQSISQK